MELLRKDVITNTMFIFNIRIAYVSLELIICILIRNKRRRVSKNRFVSEENNLSISNIPFTPSLVARERGDCDLLFSPIPLLTT